MKKTNLGITASLESRRQIFEVFLVAAVLALGINLFSSYLTAQEAGSLYQRIVIGLLISVPLLYLILTIWMNRKSSLELDLVVPIHREKNKIVQIPRYRFSEEIARITEAVFLENAALKHQWDSDPLIKNNHVSPESKNVDVSTRENGDKEIEYFSIVKILNVEDKQGRKKSETLLCEAVEFVVIEELSMHLSSYFKDYSSEDSHITEVTRNQISDVLLENRFLELLTKNWDERPIFLKAKIESPKDSVLCSIRGSDGSFYSRFDLMLPTDTRISRPEVGLLRLENKRFKLDICVEFSGFNAVLPRLFSDAYIGVPSKQLTNFKVKVSIHFQLKILALLSIYNWNYYQWVDSFFERLDKNLSFSDFLKRIDWEAASTLFSISRFITRMQAIESQKHKSKQIGETGQVEVATNSNGESNGKLH